MDTIPADSGIVAKRKSSGQEGVTLEVEPSPKKKLDCTANIFQTAVIMVITEYPVI